MSYRYGRGNFGSKPVEAGKGYNIQITETSRKGDGIARIRGFVIFVKGAQIGQDVKAKVKSVGEQKLLSKYKYKRCYLS